jgi:hypothetical protein
VEFYIDDKLEETVKPPIFIWRWDKNTFFRHKIKVIAYDNAGNSNSDELNVWKFF